MQIILLNFNLKSDKEIILQLPSLLLFISYRYFEIHWVNVFPFFVAISQMLSPYSISLASMSILIWTAKCPHTWEKLLSGKQHLCGIISCILSLPCFGFQFGNKKQNWWNGSMIKKKWYSGYVFNLLKINLIKYLCTWAKMMNLIYVYKWNTVVLTCSGSYKV